MTTDNEGWSITSQALDQHESTAVLRAALKATAGEDIVLMALDEIAADNFASDLSIELGRAGYALVRISPVPFTSRKED
jgi:hypothetical protein